VLGTSLAIAGTIVTLVTWRLEHHPDVGKSVESGDLPYVANKDFRFIDALIRKRLPRAALTGIFAAVLLPTLVVVAVILIHCYQRPSLMPGTQLLPNALVHADRAAIPGDKTTFVADVTIPDGSAVEVGKRFIKIWGNPKCRHGDLEESVSSKNRSRERLWYLPVGRPCSYPAYLSWP
jgi:hypothetical protein